MIGTLVLTQISMSCGSRSLEAWQIWLTAKGAAFFSGWRLVLAEFVSDPRHPFVQHLDGARVQRRKRSDDAGLALRDDQFGPGHDEQRRADHRQFERICKRSGQRHLILPWGFAGSAYDIIGLDGGCFMFNIEQIDIQ